MRAQCSARSRKLILYRGRGLERVSRGNKFRQIVLPALYTVAHEVERSVPSVPADQPSRDRCLSPASVTVAAATSRSTVDTRTSVIAGEGDMRLAPPTTLQPSPLPLYLRRTKTLPFPFAIFFAPATSNRTYETRPPLLAPFKPPPRVLVLSIPLGINPLLYIP